MSAAASKDAILIGALGMLPKHSWSRLVGVVSRLPLPRLVTQASIKAFASAYGVKVDEAELDLSEYRTLGAFFTRRLKQGSRPIDRRPKHAVSPADGCVLNAGRIEAGTLIQAKGRHFSLSELMGDAELASRFLNGSWLTVYLSPGDYHRVHHPVEGVIRRARYIPGSLWPVNRLAVDNVDRLFCINERVLTLVDSPLGEVATIMVGATSVGEISLRYHEGFRTNRKFSEGELPIVDGCRVARGDELGTFHLGSTAIVLFADSTVQLTGHKHGQRIRLGDAIAKAVRGKRKN